MEIFRHHDTETQRNIDDCQRLAEVFFEEEVTGVYRREVYAPLDFPKLQKAGHPAIPCFLRIATNTQDSLQTGAIEVIQCFENGETTAYAGYIATDRGEFYAEASQDVLPIAPQLSWPTVFFAPQITSCLEGLRNPHHDPEIDASTLLDELMRIPDSENHVVEKSIEDIEVDGFSFSMSYKRHSMPDELAIMIRKGEPFFEGYRFSIKRGGRLNNDIYLHFGRGGKLKGYRDVVGQRDPNKTLADLAAFSRMVLN